VAADWDHTIYSLGAARFADDASAYQHLGGAPRETVALASLLRENGGKTASGSKAVLSFRLPEVVGSDQLRKFTVRGRYVNSDIGLVPLPPTGTPSDAVCARGGEMYCSGSREGKVAAAIYFDIAARAGHAEARNGLAWCYFTGAGVSNDIHRAVELFEKAADAGCRRAQCNLGVGLYFLKWGEILRHRRDRSNYDGFALLLQAANALLPHAIVLVSALYASGGSGVPHDAYASEMWLKRVVIAPAEVVALASNFRDTAAGYGESTQPGEALLAAAARLEKTGHL
jgi:TPR repeat protein